MTLLALLIVFASVAGYHWGHILEGADAHVYRHDVIVAALGFTVLALFFAVWSEALVGKIEDAVEDADARRAQAAQQQALVLDDRFRQVATAAHRLVVDAPGGQG